MNETFDSSMLEKQNTLFQLSSSVIDESLIIEGGTDVVQECLELARKKLGLLKSSQVDGEVSSVQLSTRTPTTHISEVTLKEPLPVRTKGCGKRLKGGKEKAVLKKGRRCNGCGKVGQAHDKRNCPVLLARLAQDVTLNFEDEDEDEEEDEDIESASGN